MSLKVSWRTFSPQTETEIVKSLLSGGGQDVKRKSLKSFSVSQPCDLQGALCCLLSVVWTATIKLVGFCASSSPKVKTNFGTG